MRVLPALFDPSRLRRPQPGEGAQALIGVTLLLLIVPFAFKMKLANFEVFTHLYAWQFLGRGLLLTLETALLSILLSLPLATLFALGRLSFFPGVRLPSIAVVEGVRALPVLLFIYFIFRIMTRSGINLAPLNVEALMIDAQAFVPVVVALTLYTTAVNAETLRSGILSLDKGQTEAAMALGLGYWARTRYVILPQAFRRVLPPLIAQFTTLVKDTSLGYIVTLLELTRRAEILYQQQYNPLETLYVVAIIYFLINFVLGQVAHDVERRLQSDRRVASASL